MSRINVYNWIKVVNKILSSCAGLYVFLDLSHILYFQLSRKLCHTTFYQLPTYICVSSFVLVQIVHVSIIIYCYLFTKLNLFWMYYYCILIEISFDIQCRKYIDKIILEESFNNFLEKLLPKWKIIWLFILCYVIVLKKLNIGTPLVFSPINCKRLKIKLYINTLYIEQYMIEKVPFLYFFEIFEDQIILHMEFTNTSEYDTCVVVNWWFITN